MTSDRDLNGFPSMPFVHEITYVSSCNKCLIRSMICSKTILGVAMKTIDAFFITSSKESEA